MSKLSRATQGVKIMKVADDANIIALAKVVGEDDENGETKTNDSVDKSDGQLSFDS